LGVFGIWQLAIQPEQVSRNIKTFVVHSSCTTTTGAAMQTYLIRNLKTNRNIPRLWLQGAVASNAGFVPRKRYSVEVQTEGEGLGKKVTLKLSDDGKRVVTGAVKGDKEVPVIDLNSREVLGIFEGMEQVRIVIGEGEISIMPLATQVRIKERLDRIRDKVSRGEPLSVGSLSHGGGVLSLAIHDGLKAAGHSVKLAFANDIREDLLEHAQSKNPAWTADTQMLSAPMQELAFDYEAMGKLASCDLLEAGLPCQGASLSGRAKGGLDCAEAHEDVGHLLVAFLAILARVNPAAAVIENVPPYQNTASMWILRHSLRDMGYVVHETVLDGADWNVMEHRKRMCLVAVTVGMEFSVDSILMPAPETHTLSECLDDVAEDASCWSEMQYLRDKEVRDKADGKGFAMQLVGPESTKIGTIGKGYAKNRSTEPKVVHPTNPSLLRLLSPAEHARVKGVRTELIDGLCATIAHEMLGQGIVPAPFVAVGKALGQCIWSASKIHSLRKLADMPAGVGETVRAQVLAVPRVAPKVTVEEKPQLALEF
jgi:DNA (cytosine-5)-methyltransferase 1